MTCSMISFMGLLQIALVGAATVAAPRGADLLQSSASTDMPPCKRCGTSQGHSRDNLLAREDGELVKMKSSLETEVPALEKEVEDLKKKNGLELGKLDKRLTAMNADYKKFGEDEVSRTAKFAVKKATVSKALDAALSETQATRDEIKKVHDSMDEMRSYLNPLVDRMVSGKGWPHGCKCDKAKALLQHLQAEIRLASVDLGEVESPNPKAALLRRSAKASTEASPEKYKLVHEVQGLEIKRAKLMEEKTDEITGYSTQQRITLERINTAKVKGNLKSSNERKYKDGDKDLEKVLKNQIDAAGDFLASSKAQLTRLKTNEGAALKEFGEFKAELQKCKCL